jgi:cytochrome b involved in lipid metabolism
MQFANVEAVAKYQAENADKVVMVVDGSVYDVTSFVADHPGGEKPLLNSKGKDATENFVAVGHSESTVAMMNEKFLIGKVAKKGCCPMAAACPIIIAAAVVIAGVVLYRKLQ